MRYIPKLCFKRKTPTVELTNRSMIIQLEYLVLPYVFAIDSDPSRIVVRWFAFTTSDKSNLGDTLSEFHREDIPQLH
jgi:hypothetical protein